ncbi:uncharacterized protein LOC141875547 [Acropora palmata]
MAPNSIEVSYQENYAILYMKSGENRLNLNFLKELNATLDDIERNKDVAFMITTGEGKFYSNGLDLDLLRNAPIDEVKTTLKGFSELLLRLLTLPFPTIAALNGHAFAGGALIALAHDYRVMRTKQGWFSINEIHLGLNLGKAQVSLIREKVKDSKALADVVLMGKRFVAEEALAGGIVHKICPLGELLVTAVEMGKTALGHGEFNRRIFTEFRSDLYSDLVAAFRRQRAEFEKDCLTVPHFLRRASKL